ncbi:MAG: hypothetical protein RIG61_01280 [Deltaproteobacteria bacterium]
MALNAKELTDLSKEGMKARASLDRILDFVDLMNKKAEELEGDIEPAGEKIKNMADEMAKHIEGIKDQVDTQLNNIEVNPEETKEAAEKLFLYHGTVHQVISWADTQKSGHKEGSYWWRYWVSVLDNVMQMEVAKGSDMLEKVES